MTHKQIMGDYYVIVWEDGRVMESVRPMISPSSYVDCGTKRGTKHYGYVVLCRTCAIAQGFIW